MGNFAVQKQAHASATDQHDSCCQRLAGALALKRIEAYHTLNLEGAAATTAPAHSNSKRAPFGTALRTCSIPNCISLEYTKGAHPDSMQSKSGDVGDLQRLGSEHDSSKHHSPQDL